MKPKILLRIAAALIFIHSVLHTFGFTTWKQAPDAVYKSVVDGMVSHKFPFMGAVHSLGDFYDGFGYASSIALFLIAVLLWFVSGEQTGLSKKIVFVLGVALTAWGVDELIYFFPLAAIMTLISAALTIVAGFMMKMSSDSN